MNKLSVGWVGWTFENGASSKIDDVLTEDGGLLHVHLNFFLMDKQGGIFWTILTFLTFLWDPSFML